MVVPKATSEVCVGLIAVIIPCASCCLRVSIMCGTQAPAGFVIVAGILTSVSPARLASAWNRLRRRGRHCLRRRRRHGRLHMRCRKIPSIPARTHRRAQALRMGLGNHTWYNTSASARQSLRLRARRTHTHARLPTPRFGERTEGQRGT